jgi:transglutaminase/protease-like cytokinesis protein 3
MKKKTDKNRIGLKFNICLVLMVAAVLLIPSATAKATDLTRIDSTTFRQSTKISTIHIGSDVSEITSGAFRGLLNLRSITVSENNPFYTSYSNCLYDKDMTELICFPAALTGAMIPETAVIIRENALYGVPEGLKKQIRGVINGQASENMTEWQVPGERFVHTASGIKWKRADGTLQDPDTELKKLVASVIDSSTTAEMTQKKQLRSCFDYFVSTSSYERKMNVPVGNWTGDYAKDILSTGKGNCYNYAAAFAYIAKGLGYDAKVCTGTVSSNLGGRTPHAWTEVKMGDNWYIFDAEMQGAKGDGYYKQTYDSYPAGPIRPEAAYTVTY